MKNISEPFKSGKIIENNEQFIKIVLELPLSNTSNKLTVNYFHSNIIKPPISKETLVNIFIFLETEDWNSVFSRTCKITREAYLQSFQYKILNMLLDCNDRLYKKKIKNNNKFD